MPLLTEDAKGVYVIAVTPFSDNGDVDWASVDRMVDFYQEKGATGLTILGQLGEAPKLTAEESREIARRVISRAKIPVVVGITAPGLAPMRELADSVMEIGAAGVMVAPPWTLKTDDQIYAYFASVGDVLGKTPWVLQDYPLTTNVTIAPKVIDRIVRDIPTCVMLKHEDWPGLSKITALRAASDKGETRRISILCGNGGLFLPEEVARGADGAMTGFCYPEMMVDVVENYAKGNPDRAHDIFDAYLPLARYEQQQGIGLACRKYVLAKRGVISSATLRKPAPALSKLDIADVESLLARQEKRLKEIAA